jgi:hypothetical protein
MKTHNEIFRLNAKVTSTIDAGCLRVTPVVKLQSSAP